MERFAVIVPSADGGRPLNSPVETVYGTDAEPERTSLPKKKKKRYSTISTDTTMPMTEKKSEQARTREHESEAHSSQLRIA